MVNPIHLLMLPHEFASDGFYKTDGIRSVS